MKRVDQINQDDLVLSMEAHAKSLRKDKAVLDALTRAIGGKIEPVGRMETFWRERATLKLSTTAGTGGAALNATSIPVADPTSFHIDEMIFHPASGDMFIVDEAVGGTAAAGHVKVRGMSGAGGITTAVSEGDILLVGPHTHAEGFPVPAPFSNNSVTKKTHVFQTDATIGLTDILNEEETYGDKEIEEMRRDKYTEHLERFCLALYNSKGGRETVSSGNGARRHTPTGLNEYLATQVTDFGAGVPTLAAIGEALRLTTIHGGGGAESKVFVVGQNMNNAITAMPANALRAASGDALKWGVRVSTLITGYGNLSVVYDPLLSAENGMAGEAYILDKSSFKQIQLGKLALRILRDTSAKNDPHNIQDIYTGTRGLKFFNIEKSRRLTNIG